MSETIGAENEEPRCAGCGYTRYGHGVAIAHMIARAHEWTPIPAAVATPTT